MIVLELPTQAGPQHSNSFVGELLAAACSDSYANSLFRIARGQTGCDLLTVFTRDHASPPTCLLTSGSGDSAVLDSAASAYCRRHFRVDPILQKVLPSAGSEASLQVHYFARDASDAAYRRDCYEEPGLSERLGFYCPTPGGWMWLNVYRRAGAGAFSARHVDAVAAFARVFLAVVASRQPPPVEAATRLSAQEGDVIRLSLEGATAKEIARLLDVSPATVTTYRQRAYRKLNVRNQRELVAARLSPSVWTDVRACTS